jgi:putative transcriptional regulator
MASTGVAILSWLWSLLRKGVIDLSRIRFYIGYSGWSEGQLTEELNQKSWLTLEATRKLVFP